MSHPVFGSAPEDARVIHIWDDVYLKAQGYSLKRLVFIYETLCALSIEIVRGDTRAVLESLEASHVYVPHTLNPFIRNVVQHISTSKKVDMVADAPFVVLDKARDFTRFFQYWGKAEKRAFMQNGGADAKGN